jgi:hypothetical protein
MIHDVMYDLCCIGIVETRKRKRHTEEEKQAAVKLWKSGQGMSLAEVEQRTGVAATNVRRYTAMLASPEEKKIRYSHSLFVSSPMLLV